MHIRAIVSSNMSICNTVVRNMVELSIHVKSGYRTHEGSDENVTTAKIIICMCE